MRRLATATLVLALVTLAALQWWPLPRALSETPWASVVLARDGSLLGATIAADEQWRFPPLNTVPDRYRQAVLMFEDRRFHQHPGVDPLAIARAAWRNWQAGKVVSGGSTVTMQLARQLRGDPPRTLGNKILEAALALQLEWHFSKSEILALYASRAPFGGNIVGLPAASWRYFARPPEDLSWAEAALFAVLPNHPAMIHPGRMRERLLWRRNALLQRLADAGRLNQMDLSLALLEPLPERPQPLPRLAPHLLAQAQQHAGQSSHRTTLEAGLQQATLALAERHGRRLAGEGIHNLAILVIDHQQMTTVAYVGNQAWQSLLRHAPDVDIIRRPRSTGSILKPVLYGLMLEEGLLLPSTLVADIPTNFAGYSPENFDREFRGAVPASEALARSLNIPAVRMLQQYGVSRFQHQLQTLGLSSLFRPADDYGLTLILGGAEASLWELTAIYARLAASAATADHQPLPATPRWLQDSTDITNHGATRRLSQGAAWLTLQALMDVQRPGADAWWRDYAGSQALAWKTGTSYGLRDAWAIGSNARYSVGVWAGNASGESAPQLSGLNSAAPVMLDVFDLLGRQDWPLRPEAALKEVQACRNDGYLAGSLCDAVTSLAPRHSHFETVTPHHRRVHLDQSGQHRVHAQCEPVDGIRTAVWFVLPPAQEHYWRRHHGDYQRLPPWRPDCIAALAELEDDVPMDLIYPQDGARFFIPRELDGRRGQVVMHAAHRDPDAQLQWHLGTRFLGSTRVFHQQAISPEPGWHRLTVVDEQGYRLERHFEVLDQGTRQH
ncbi:MAG: penicillin-binding protein 1C [Alcanivoracaceae bacterium]